MFRQLLMNTIRKISTVILLIVSFLSVKGQGYEINITVNGLKDTTVILGHYLNQSMYPDDTVRVNFQGKGTFTGEEKLPGGLYVIFLPSTLYFEIIMGDDQHFSIETDTADFLSSLNFDGSLDNQIFLDFQKYMIELREKAENISSRLNTETDPAVQERLKQELNSVNNERIAAIDSIANIHSELFVTKFLQATSDIIVPDDPPAGYQNGPNWQYYYYRDHYFDNFDYTDSRLLRTPFYEDKIINYITRVIPQIPDSVIQYTDILIENSRQDSILFRYMLITLFNHFGRSSIMGMDAVQINIAEKYYIPESWWSEPDFIADLINRVEKTKPLLTGKIAPDIELMSVPADHIIQAASDTALKRYPHAGSQIRLHQIKSKYTVLVFWEAECGFCKTVVPELYDLYKQSLSDKGVQVIAVNTLFGEEGKELWIDFINDNQLYDWINAWNPYSYEFKLTYDIVSTPQIYLLNENKEIIAKKINPSQVLEIINSIDI